MKYARIRTSTGVFEGEYDDGTVRTDDGTYEPAEYELLAPCEPSVFYCVGRNFGEKVEQMDYGDIRSSTISTVSIRSAGRPGRRSIPPAPSGPLSPISTPSDWR